MLTVAASVIQVTIPIALVVALGFIAVRTRYFPAEGVGYLAQFASRIALPSALFLVIAQEDPGTILDGEFILRYVTGTLLAALLLFTWLMWLGRGVARASLAILGGISCNCMMVGLPVTVVLFDVSTAAVMAIVSFVQDVFLLPLVLIIADATSGRDFRHSVFQAMGKTLKNPFVIATIAGVLVSASAIELPAASVRLLELLAASLAATGLFMVGGVLARFKLALIGRGFLPVVLVNLLIHPLLVLGVFWLFPIDNTMFMLAGIFAATLPMISVYPVIAMAYGFEEEAATAMFVATVASFVTITLIMSVVLGTMGRGVIAGV